MTFGARNIDRAPDVFTVKSMEWLDVLLQGNYHWLQPREIVTMSEKALGMPAEGNDGQWCCLTDERHPPALFIQRQGEPERAE